MNYLHLGFEKPNIGLHGSTRFNNLGWRFPAAKSTAGVLALARIRTVVFMADTGNTIANQFAGFGLGLEAEAHVVKFRGQFDDPIIDLWQARV